MDQKDDKNSVISSYITSITEQFKTELQTVSSWLSTIDGKILLNGIATISPYIVGNPIGFLFPFIIESTDMIIRQRFLKHLSDIGNKLESKKYDLNQEFIHTPEGQQLFKNTFRNIIQESNEEKIEYLKQFLYTSYVNKTPNSELINTFFKILTNMEPIHIKLLTVLRNPKEIFIQVANERKKNLRPLEESHYGKDYAAYFTEDVDDDLNKFYLHTENVVFSNAHKDLVTWNILESKILKFWVYFDEPNFSANLEHHLRDIQRWITPFGEEFLKYVYNDIKES